MTLDEAIEHANQVADSYKDIAPACKCAHEHRQLAGWLTELKILRTVSAELWELAESRKWIARMLGEQMAMVINLQELVRHMYECMGNIDADGNHECYSCEYENDEGKCDFKRRMEELGVETNDA